MKSVNNRSSRGFRAMALISCSLSAHAANIAWTNAAGGNWSLTNNWSPNQVPGPADTAYITNDGNYTVTLNTSAALAGLVLGEPSGSTTQTFSINGQTLTLNGQATVSSNGAFNFNSGNLAGAAVLAGTLNIQGVGLNPNSSLTVAAGSVLNITGSSTFFLQAPLTNNGTVNWLGGYVRVANNNGADSTSGVIWNNAGAQWYIQCDGYGFQNYYNNGYEIINNAGLLCKTNTTGNTLVSLYLNNTGGTVQAQSGTIQFQAGCNLAGTFQAASGAAINFSGGNYTWNGTEVFLGPGNVQITGGNVAITTYLTSPFSASGVILSNVSNLGGSAYLTNCSINDAETIVGTNITWAGGTVNPGSSLTVATNAVLNLVGNATFFLEAPMTNNGTVNWFGGYVRVANNNGADSTSGVIWNNAGAQWYIQCDGYGFQNYYNNGYEIINNAGLLCKTNATGNTPVSLYLNNTGGTVQAQSGTIQFQAGCNLAGTFQAASGAAVNFTSGNYTWNGTANFEGPGSVQITGGNVAITTYLTSPFSVSGVVISNLSNLGGSAYLTNCNIKDAETIVGTNITWSSGTINPGSSLTVAMNAVLNLVGNATFFLEAPMTNNGTVNWFGGYVRVANNNGSDSTSGVIWNNAGAQWYIQCDGYSFQNYYNNGYEIINNAGLLCKTNATGTTPVSLYLNNNGGTVEAQSGTIQIGAGCNLLGIFQAASGAAIDFTSGNYTWNGTANFEGPGSVQITGGNVAITAFLTSPFTASGVVISNLSNLGGSAYLTNCYINDAETIVGTNITWSSGTINPGSSLTVATNAVLNLVGNATFFLEAPMTNNGTVNWFGGYVRVANNNGSDSTSGVIWNNAGAQWYIQCDGYSFQTYYNNGYEIINNAGLLCKTNTTGNTPVSLHLNNPSGIVDAEIGMISINGGYTLGAGGTLSFGLNSLSSYGTIYLANTAPLNGTIAAHLENGYVPVVSNAFTVLTYGAFTGAFINTNLPSVALWQTTNAATALTIKVLKLVPQLTWPVPAPIVYGAPLTAAQLDATAASPTNLGGTLAGNFIYTPSLNTILNSGRNQTLSVTFTPTDTASNSTASTNVTITVLPAPLTITATNRAKTYGATETFAGTEFLASGLVNGDTVTSAAITSAGDAPTAQVSGSPYTITITNAVGDVGLTNYNITYDTGSLAVNPAPMIVTANGQAKLYGQTVLFGSGSTFFSASTLSNSETIGTVTLAVSGNGGVSNAPIGTYTITPSAATGGSGTEANYNITYNAGTLTVSAAPLTVTANAENKTYGQTVVFGSGSTLFTAALSNKETIGTVTLAVTGGGGVSNAPVGSYTITPSAATGGSGTETNYIITYVTNSLTVNPAALTIAANPQSKNYGQLLTFGPGSPLFTNSALSNNETIGSVTLAVSANGGAATAPVGNYTITPSAATGGSGTETNYNITYVTNTLTVGAAPLTVTANSQSKTYGQTVPFGSGSTLFTASLSNSETIGTVTLAVTGNGGVSNAPVGSYTITPSAATGGSGTESNYSITYMTNTLTVGAAPLTVTATPQSKTYGQTVAFGSGSALFAAALSNNETIGSVTLAVSGNGGAGSAPVGSYTITPSAATGGSGTETNYNITYVTNTLTVGAAPLIVGASAQGKTYGQTVVFGAGSALFTNSVLSNSETIGSVTLAVSGNGGASNAPAGLYTITPSAATGGSGTETNYSITYLTNTLTVSAAPLLVTANAQNKTYGQTLVFGSGSTLFAASLSNNETIGTVTLSVTGNGGVSNAPVGSYNITPSAAAGGSGTESNYIITYVNNTLTVSPASLTITANPQTKTFGQTLVFGSGSTLFTSSTLSNNETVGTVTLAVTGNGGASNAPAGNYTITPGAAAGGSGTETNYSITYVTNTLTVTLPTLYIAANPPNVTLSWTTNASAFVLNSTANLTPPVRWTPITSGIATNGTNYTMTLNDSGGNQFYALICGAALANPPPSLGIAFVKPNTVVVFWPATGSYTLQQNGNLATTNWTTSGYSINSANGTNSITITPAIGNQYFRLSNP